jgi:hypothetical protein
MKKLAYLAFIALPFAACDGSPNDADGRNAKDTTEKVTNDSTRMLDSTTSGMDTARESYDQNSGK